MIKGGSHQETALMAQRQDWWDAVITHGRLLCSSLIHILTDN